MSKHVCEICGKEFKTINQIESHWASHRVLPVAKEPLSYTLVLPDGVTAGRHEAAEAFAKAYAELKEKHPEKKFHLLPFSYREDEGDIDLIAILAVEI